MQVTVHDALLRSRMCDPTGPIAISDDDRKTLMKLIEGKRHTFLSTLAGAVGKDYDDLGKLRNKLDRMP
jgi:hypothetical protein